MPDLPINTELIITAIIFSCGTFEAHSEKMCNMEHRYWSERVTGKSKVKLILALNLH